METNLPPKPSEEEFEEIDTTQFKPNLKENVSLLDRGKGSRKQSRANSPSPSISAASKTNMTRDQIRYCGAIMRNLKRHRDAVPFLHPVDYVKLNVPDYPKVIKYPMDLTTIDKKLNNGEYDTVEEFVNDIRLVFKNCYKFNGPEAMISMLCQNVESAFEKSLRQMPPSRGNTPPPRSPVSDAEDDLLPKKKPVKKPTASPRDDARPKREIHPPPSKDYPEPMTKRRNPRKNDIQMRFCMQTLRELKKNKYRDINYPFLQPVDVVALNIPDYVDIIKHPMDLSTIEQKLNEGAYDEPEEFEQDVRLMFNNCYTYNPATLPVHKMGRELERVFDEKWAKKPDPVADQAMDDFTEGEDSDEDERDQKIAELERHIATISQQIVSLKSQKKQKKTPVRRPPPKKPAATEKRKRVTKKKEGQVGSKTTPKRPSAVEEFPEFTFDQKKDLSDRINNLQGDDLNTVVQIIQNSMPNLNGGGQDEIVLDIDSLDRRTLHKLHKFVTGESLTSKPPSKKARTQYKDKPLHKYSDDSSSESDSGSSSGSDSDDSGSSSD